MTDLFIFLNGYEFARSQLHVDLTAEEEQFYDEFQPWLQRKLGMTSVTSWAKLIMLSCHDEKAGFERFFHFANELIAEEYRPLPYLTYNVRARAVCFVCAIVCAVRIMKRSPALSLPQAHNSLKEH